MQMRTANSTNRRLRLRAELTDMIEVFDLTKKDTKKKCFAVHTTLIKLRVRKKHYHNAYANAHLMLTRMLDPKPRGRPKRVNITETQHADTY
jgi:hypothetical protein